MSRRSITVVPHTHWDREWYLPFEGFRDRLVPIMDELLDLLDRGYPHFHLDGQTALIDDYLAVRPEREADIARHAKAGRISVGPWLTLVDEFLVSGETIVRSLELGLARARELGGGDLVGYLPDQFGHIGQMPQILAAGGFEHAVVWRGVPRSIESTPFWWEAPDGSRVLAEYLPFGYGFGAHVREAQEPDALAATLEDLARRLDPWSTRERVLVTAGTDHLPCDPTLPERLVEARRRGLDVEIGSLAAHLQLPADGEPPVWRGELRSAARAHLLPGVYSARIDQKQERGRIEALVERYAEPLAALVPGFAWPEQELERVWRLLVLNGAHDSVCGCSVDEVAQAVDARHAEAAAVAGDIVRSALESLGNQVVDAGILRFNPSPFEREGVPGLGWRVDPEFTEAAPAELEVGVRDGWIVSAGMELALVDEPDVGDLYNFCPSAGDVTDAPDRLTGDGAEITAGFDRLEVRLRFSRREHEPFLRVGVSIQNGRPDHRLRLHIRLPQAATSAVAGSPFELVTRDLVSEGGDIEAPSPTWPARGVALAGGIAVLAEGVVEYEVVSPQELAVTLLRCVGTISREDLATRRGPAGPDVATPAAQMIGETNLARGVLPEAQPADLLPAWERFALPLRSAQARGGGTLPASGTLLEVRGAELAGVRRRDGVLETRVWNPTTAPAQAEVGGETVSLGAAAIATVRSVWP
jgi:glycosyl hydrolase family 38/alpha mannosidase-like protein